MVTREYCSDAGCFAEGCVWLACALMGSGPTQSASAVTQNKTDSRNLIFVSTPSSTVRTAWSSLQAIRSMLRVVGVLLV